MVENDRIDSLWRRLKRSSRVLAAIHTLSVSVLCPSFCREEIVPSVFLQNVTSFRYAVFGCFGEHGGSERISSCEVDLVDEGLDFRIPILGRLGEIESRDCLIYPIVVVE